MKIRSLIQVISDVLANLKRMFSLAWQMDKKVSDLKIPAFLRSNR